MDLGPQQSRKMYRYAALVAATCLAVALGPETVTRGPDDDRQP